MGIPLQVRDLPEDVHRRLKARAAASGQSLSEHVRGILERAASRPTPDELAARIEARGRVRLGEANDIAVRRLRDGYE